MNAATLHRIYTPAAARPALVLRHQPLGSQLSSEAPIGGRSKERGGTLAPMSDSLMATLFKDPHNLVRELVQDVRDAGTRINRSDSPSERRDFIRVLFTVVDGLAYALKKYALLFAISNHVSFEIEERCLVDQSFDLNDDGTVRKRRRYMSTSANPASRDDTR